MFATLELLVVAVSAVILVFGLWIIDYGLVWITRKILRKRKISRCVRKEQEMMNG